MTKITASAFLITLNCEETLEAALQSVADFAQIVVVDSGSTDKTLQIAKQYADLVMHHDFAGFGPQKEFALRLCTQKWALNLDADEVISRELTAEIEHLIEQSSVDGLLVPRIDMVFGKPAHPWTHKTILQRFFRTEKTNYDPKQVHESVRLEGKWGRAKGVILHRSDPDIKTRLEKIQLYSSLRAKDKAAAGKRPSLLKLLLAGPLIFLKTFFIRRHFLNGRGGFVLSVMNGHYAFLKEAKLFEKTR